MSLNPFWNGWEMLGNGWERRGNHIEMLMPPTSVFRTQIVRAMINKEYLCSGSLLIILRTNGKGGTNSNISHGPALG